MYKKWLFFIVAFIMTSRLNAQDYFISFAGTGASTSVSTVKVNNLTSGATKTIYGGNILRLTGTEKLQSPENKQNAIKIYPNPVKKENAFLQIYPPKSGNAVISITDLSGKIRAQIKTWLEDNVQEFRLSGISNGLYIISVKGNGYKYSGKLLCNGISDSPLRMVIMSNENSDGNKESKNDYRGTKDTIDMLFSDGDRLKFTGVSENYSTVVMDIPSKDKTITFPFLACTDKDNNSYPVVPIGSQIWMAENLKTTKYNDGSGIAYSGINDYTWYNYPEGAYGWYENDEIANKNIYGALYNWHAVNTGILCPSGWHLPTDREWMTLRDYLGGTSVAGGKIKDTGNAYWESSDKHSTNESGFSAIPGGIRNTFDFSDINLSGYWWSSTFYRNSSRPSGWYVNSGSEALGQTVAHSVNKGLSVRCVSGESGVTIPFVLTYEIKNISTNEATAGGMILSDEGGAIIDLGVCLNTSENPTLENERISNGANKDVFISNITGLQPGTTYHVRAYATNSAGTAYGDNLTFTTAVASPVLSTSSAANITQTSATSGGNITDDGGGTITERGVCWATTALPAISDAKTANGNGKGSYTVSITGLQPGTTYHTRAYATNSAGTAYGVDLTFTTMVALPVLSTSVVSNITQTSATSGGNITYDGGGTITERGVCWATTASPTISNAKTANGNGTGSFIAAITGLRPGTSYHIRAYATNTAGTAYGEDVTLTTLVALPALSTLAVSGITQTTVTSGGNITDDGGATISVRGICWSITSSPTISNAKTENGNGTGSYPVSITGLQSGTTYHVRAYATNSAGTEYGNDLTFTTLPELSVLSTTAFTNITQSSATSGGNITDDGGGTITERGVCWATTPAPTINNTKTSNGVGTGSFTTNLTGLQPGTIYYVRAYATNGAGTAYGEGLVLTTLVALPVLSTSAVTNRTQTTATSGGNITSDGGGSIAERGVCWATTAAPTISDAKTANGSGTGSFTVSLTGLQPGTTYHARAYATNSAGTAYGNDMAFTTLTEMPVLATSAPTNISQTSVIAGGNITDDGGRTITERGVCWATTPAPTISDAKTANGSGTGNFTVSITELQPGTTYHVRAYAINGAGTGYGNDLSFATLTELPVLTTSAVTNITETSAISGGNISSDGGRLISERGVCWSPNLNPTISDTKLVSGSGTDSFPISITGLQPGTAYHVRAYATNSAGTSYGNQVSFYTNPLTPPVVNFSSPIDGFLLHSAGDKRIVLKTIGADNYIKFSSDNGVSYNEGVKVTGIFNRYNKARILENGNIVLFCINKIYYSDNNLATINPCNVLTKNGEIYSLHQPVNPAYPGGYFNFMGGFVEKAGVCLLGNYTNSATGASPVNLYYSLDGITWKVIYSFGQHPGRTDNGSSGGGTGGTPLGDPDNPLITRHIHAVNIGEDGNFYVSTGDISQEMHFLKCSYNRSADAWVINDLLTGERRNWQRMRALGIYERNGYLYWGSDGPGTFTFEGVTYNCLGIYKCAVSDINDPSKHILLQPLEDACYSFVNAGYLVIAGLQSYGYVYISFDHGETWQAYAKPSWMAEEVSGIWYNELSKHFGTDTSVIISSEAF